MGFYDRAWNSAADSYGAARAEKYGRIARFWAWVKVMACVALAIGIVVVWMGR
jgi:hypothetical protein